MKKVFTLITMCFLGLSLVAQNPFTKKQSRTYADRSNTQLKATSAADDPTGMTSYNWSGSAWENPNVYVFTYNGAGLLETSTSSSNRVLYEYDGSGNKTKETYQNWDGSQWTNSNEQRYTYDSEGEESEGAFYYWDGAQWVLSSGNRNITTYSDGKKTSHIWSHYESGTSSWVEDGGWKDEVIKDGMDRVIEENYYERIGEAWVLDNYSHYTYDGQGRVEFSLEGGGGQTMKFYYFYNASDVLIEATVYEVDVTENLIGRYTDAIWAIWDPVGFMESSYLQYVLVQMWDGSQFNDAQTIVGDIYGYSGTGTPPIYTETISEWNGSGWDPVSRETEYDGGDGNYMEEDYIAGNWYVTREEVMNSALRRSYNATLDNFGNITDGYHDEWIYDSFGAMIEYFNKQHNGVSWIQQSGDKTIITYEGTTSKKLEEVSQFWNTSMYVNNERKVYDYTTTGFEDLKTAPKVYPTSFTSEVTITSTSDGNARFYDLTGKELLKVRVNKGTNAIVTGSLPKGYYIIMVDGSQGKQFYKVMKR